jgi:hypothetical protein
MLIMDSVGLRVSLFKDIFSYYKKINSKPELRTWWLVLCKVYKMLKYSEDSFKVEKNKLETWGTHMMISVM